MTQRSCAECAVRDQALCGALDDCALSAFATHGRRRRLARGETLVWAGDEAVPCATLLSGVVKLCATTADGRDQIVGLLYPADFIGRPFAGAAEFSATALNQAELCVFPRGAFERVLEANPAMERRLLARTFAALDEARGRMLMLARMSAAEKVASLLLDVAARAGAAGAERFELPFTRGEMAEVLGLTIETVSRQLGRLKARGAIALHGARGIAIRDRAMLVGTDRAARA
ncbi:MAG: Crp/Fnr family transcriptional regulator [Sphingomonas sp.]